MTDPDLELQPLRTNNTRVIGVDPGPIPGFVVLDLDLRPGHPDRLLDAQTLQCTAGAAPLLFSALILRAGPRLIAIEKFVIGNRAAKSRAARAGQTTRDLAATLEADASEDGCQVVSRSASEVKPWATAARLRAAGLEEITKGMRHAADAGRHALFAAVADLGMPDPLSRTHHRSWSR